MKGLDNEKAVRRWKELGYEIVPIPALKGKITQYFHVLKNGVTIVEIAFDSIAEDEKYTDLDERSGTISVLSVVNGYRCFKKLIGMYVIDEGIVFDYEDRDGNPRTVRENSGAWVF